MRAVIYARVSSAAQRDAHTIESQLHVLRAFVLQQGWTLVETFCDDGRSAKTGQLEKRDAWARLVRDAELGRFEVLVVLDVNRLTRTGSIEERAEILGPFQRLGIQIATPSGGMLDLQSFLGEFWVTVQALVAAEENRKRATAIKAGKVRAIAEGRKPAGPTPFGLAYSRATGQWSPDEGAAVIVREILERLAAGESCVRLADDLGLRGERGPRKGWTRAAVYRIVSKRYVCGEWTVDKKRGVAIAVPRLVSDEVWLAAQRTLAKNGKRGLNRTRHVYLLQGVARCRCGEPIVIRSGVKYYNAARELREHPAAYLCRGRQRKSGCAEPITACRDLDDRVWAALSAELEQPELIAALADVEVRRASDARDWSKDADGYRAHLQRLDRVEAEFMMQYRRGHISKGAWEAELPKLARERKMVGEQLEAALQALGSIASTQARVRSATSTVQRLRFALPKARPEDRRALLRELIDDGGVTITNGRALLDLRLVRGAAEGSRGAHDGGMPVRAVEDPDYSSRYEATLRIRMVA